MKVLLAKGRYCRRRAPYDIMTLSETSASESQTLFANDFQTGWILRNQTSGDLNRKQSSVTGRKKNEV